MNKIEAKIIDNFNNIKDDIYSDFGSLWMNNKAFDTHIDKRISKGHIADKQDYINKTLDCLANSSEYILAQHSKSWDNICYNKNKDWAVIFNEQGQIMTSYKIEHKADSFEQKHIQVKAKITKGVTDAKFRRYFNRLRS